uniref:Rho GTPase activating protein 4 n=1 Tax=Tetraodon nigroviridis TaxID=99883 RepID=H3CHE9_TETNG
VPDLRAQLTDQVKVLDSQVEVKQQQLSDLSEFLRRRGDIEAEYARALDKLTERFTHKTKKKEQWGQSVCEVWSVLLNQTRLESREHAALDTCCNALTQRLVHVSEDTHRLHKRSKEVGIQMQEELLKVTTELQTALKTYNQYHTDCLIAEGKLKDAERLEERHTGKSADLGLSQSGGQRRSSVKKMERLMEKRHGRVQETQLKCTKARNDYLLNLAAANAAMNKYYLQDVSTLIDCCDLGFHLSVERVMRCYLASRGRIQKAEEAGVRQLEAAVASLDQGGDRDALLQQHDTAFCLPFRFHYHPHEGDQVCEVSAESQVRYELETRFQQLQSRLAAVTLETEEVSKTLKATLTALLDNVCDGDCDPSPDLPSSQSHEPLGGGPAPKLTLAKRRANQQEAETYYLTKVKEFLTSSSLSSKLQAKHDLLQEAIQKAEAVNSDPSRMQCARSLRVRKSRPVSQFGHTLFTTDIVCYLQQIPVVVESCIRFINLHGLHHEGIFRVPGSQRVINLLRDAFERAGEDPLSDSECDLDSVAGVLKLYFRGLEPPLFPYDSYPQLHLSRAEVEEETERAAHIKAIVSSFPRPLLIVLRYLFAFLNHVSQYSDENMMQPYNLAVCFGPSLLRGVEADEAVTQQPQVNDLVKTMILQHDLIFPGQPELAGPVYEKHMTLEQEYCEPITEEGEGEPEHLPSEDGWVCAELEAVALFDYVARSPAELSLKVGELVVLHSKASCDWWRGEVGGVKGLIPHKYISVLDGTPRPRAPAGRWRRGRGSGGAPPLLGSHRSNAPTGCGSTATAPRCQGDRGEARPARRRPRPRPHATCPQELISRQMNSVFKELLSRQSPGQQFSPASAPTPAGAPPSGGSPPPAGAHGHGFSSGHAGSGVRASSSSPDPLFRPKQPF